MKTPVMVQAETLTPHWTYKLSATLEQTPISQPPSLAGDIRAQLQMKIVRTQTNVKSALDNMDELRRQCEEYPGGWKLSGGT